MGNITSERSVTRYGTGNDVLPWKLNLPMAASTKILEGGMVAASTAAATAGQAVKGGASTAQMMIGIAEKTVDNSSGAAGALTIDVRSGVFNFANSGGADAIAAQHVGMPCYAVDDQTVALGDNAGARPLAGTIVMVDSTFGVWVAIGCGVSSSVPDMPVSLFIDLTTAANATLLTWTPQFSGKIKRISFTTSKPAAGAGAAVTITPNIAGTPLTGGVLTLTLGTVVAAAEIFATTITAGQMFSAGQTITLVGSSFTAFTAGSGTICLHLG